MPQSKDQKKRIDCSANDGTYKAHYLASQSSKNIFEWRVKRSSKSGNCTIRVSTDGENFSPLLPVGKTIDKFSCGRKTGYESMQYNFPKSLVAEKGAVVQLEFETEYGTIVQCADIIVQREEKFQNVKCDPKCKNGGVCQNGVCKCGKMFTGDNCEEKIDASGSFSFIMFIFMVALVAAGVALLYQKDKF